MALKTNYKDDGFTGNRKYRQITNADNTLSFEDVTAYNPVGDNFGAKDINDTNTAVNSITNPTFEDYTSTAVPDPETALSGIKSKASITTLFTNIKAVLKGAFLKMYLLTTKEQLMANTLAGRTADALLTKQLNQDLGALNDSGAIKGMDAREDGVYITYSTGADTVTKKLGNLGNTSYIQAEPTYRRVAAEFDVSDCNKILFTCKTSGSAIWFMGSNESTYVINTGTSLGFCTSSANETKEYDVSSYKYFRVEMLGSGIVQNIKFS